MTEISKGINYELSVKDDGSPKGGIGSPIGIGGWINGGKHALVYDDYDIWQVDVSGNTSPVCLTEGMVAVITSNLD